MEGGRHSATYDTLKKRFGLNYETMKKAGRTWKKSGAGTPPILIGELDLEGLYLPEEGAL